MSHVDCKKWHCTLTLKSTMPPRCPMPHIDYTLSCHLLLFSYACHKGPDPWHMFISRSGPVAMLNVSIKGHNTNLMSVSIYMYIREPIQQTELCF